MATYYVELQSGVIMRCYRCKAPLRYETYHHQCDKLPHLRPHCFDCLVERGNCGHCGLQCKHLFHAVLSGLLPNATRHISNNDTDLDHDVVKSTPNHVDNVV